MEKYPESIPIGELRIALHGGKRFRAAARMVMMSQQASRLSQEGSSGAAGQKPAAAAAGTQVCSLQ